MTTPLDQANLAVQRPLMENVLAHFAWAYDLDKLEYLDACFTTECEVEFGDTGLKAGRDAVMVEFRRRREKYRHLNQIPWHVITNVFVRMESSTRASVSSWYGFGTMHPGKPMALDRFGRYEDLFVLEEEAWRIARRQIFDLNHSKALVVS
jgi:SnoaL-like domain